MLLMLSFLSRIIPQEQLGPLNKSIPKYDLNPLSNYTICSHFFLYFYLILK